MARKPAGTPIAYDFLDDDETRRSLIVLADATAEVVGKGEAYDAIVKVAAVSTETNYQDAREKFDDIEPHDRVRIQDQAIETLGGMPLTVLDLGSEKEEDAEEEGGVETLDWASGMMRNFPKLSGNRDGD